MRLEDIKRYFIFLLGGGLGLLVNLILTFIFTEYFLLDSMISYSIGLIANIFVNFTYHINITFKIKQVNARKIVKFIAVFSAITLMNWILVYLFTKKIVFFEWHYYYLATIFVVTLFISIINFIINKAWVFKD